MTHWTKKSVSQNTGLAAAEPLVAVLAQRGVNNIDTLNRLVTHGSRLDMHVLVREETRDIMLLTRARASLTRARRMTMTVMAVFEVKARGNQGKQGRETGTQQEV